MPHVETPVIVEIAESKHVTNYVLCHAALRRKGDVQIYPSLTAISGYYSRPFCNKAPGCPSTGFVEDSLCMEILALRDLSNVSRRVWDEQIIRPQTLCTYSWFMRPRGSACLPPPNRTPKSLLFWGCFRGKHRHFVAWLLHGVGRQARHTTVYRTAGRRRSTGNAWAMQLASAPLLHSCTITTKSNGLRKKYICIERRGGGKQSLWPLRISHDYWHTAIFLQSNTQLFHPICQDIYMHAFSPFLAQLATKRATTQVFLITGYRYLYVYTIVQNMHECYVGRAHVGR